MLGDFVWSQAILYTSAAVCLPGVCDRVMVQICCSDSALCLVNQLCSLSYAVLPWSLGAGSAAATSQSKQAPQHDAAKQAQPVPSQVPASPNQTSPALSRSKSRKSSKTRSTHAHAEDTTSPNQSKADVQRKLDQSTQTAPHLEQTGSPAVSQQASSRALRSRSSKSANVTPRRTWLTAQNGKPGFSGNVLVDEYSSVISDSEDSDAEEAQPPVSMLRNVSANMIQSSKSSAVQAPESSTLIALSADMCCALYFACGTPSTAAKTNCNVPH